jgi:nucleotide-binding universal stress UspA family protein
MRFRPHIDAVPRSMSLSAVETTSGFALRGPDTLRSEDGRATARLKWQTCGRLARGRKVHPDPRTNGKEDVFKRIMAPVDLAHIERLGRALDCAADLAKHYRVPITYVGVTATAPSRLGHTPEEFGQKLQAFTQREIDRHGVEAEAHTAIAHDPPTEVDDALLRAVDETGADLVVMASHVPDVIDYIWPSNGGKLAEHAKCSVMVVRP